MSRPDEKMNITMKEGVMTKTQCLWCGVEFGWEPGLYRFCDKCVDMLSYVETVVRRAVGRHIDVTFLVEREIISGGKSYK